MGPEISNKYNKGLENGARVPQKAKSCCVAGVQGGGALARNLEAQPAFSWGAQSSGAGISAVPHPGVRLDANGIELSRTKPVAET